jgi:hypothetical protein
LICSRGFGGAQDPKPQEKSTQTVEESKMNGLPDRVRILQSSQNPEELEKAAESLAMSSNESDFKYLEGSLRNKSFLNRLDPPKGHGLEVDRFRNVLLALGRSPHPYATKILLELSEDSQIRNEMDRVDVLLEAAAALTPLPAERIPLLRAFGADYFLLKFKLLVDNGSPIGLAELEQEILAKPPDIEDESVISLMHRSFVPHRTDEPLIRMAEDLLKKNISSALRAGLLESFFDYQSRIWYGPVRVPPEPADLNAASTSALRELLQLADMAKDAAIPADLKHKVLATQRTIQRVVEQRKGHN